MATEGTEADERLLYLLIFLGNLEHRDVTLPILLHKRLAINRTFDKTKISIKIQLFFFSKHLAQSVVGYNEGCIDSITGLSTLLILVKCMLILQH